MSTKTTFKRIALVTVASMGFGILTSVAPATAVDGTSAGAIALDNSYLTVIQNTERRGVVRIALTDIDGLRDTLTRGQETITAVVTGVPAVDTKTVGLNATDITFQELKETTAGAKDYVVESSAAVAASVWTDGVIAGGTAAQSGNTPVSSEATTNPAHIYAMALIGSATGTANTVDKGYYTVRFRLTDATGFVLSEKTLRIQFVSSDADSGAVITATATGSIQKGQAIGYSTNNKITVTLRDANAGRIQKSPASGYVPLAPTLTAALTDVDGVVLTTGTLLSPIQEQPILMWSLEQLLLQHSQVRSSMVFMV